MQLTVLKPEDPNLRKACTPVTKKDLRKNTVQEEIEEMLDFVYGSNNKGEERNRDQAMTVGLSANQVGLHRQISIVDLAIGMRNYSDIHVLINPEIIWQSAKQTEKIEGCVNLPHIWGYVQRSQKIKVKALDRAGNEIVLTLEGWSARLLQHEIAHLNGKLFIDILQNPKQALHVEDTDYAKFKKDKKSWNKFIDISHLVV